MIVAIIAVAFPFLAIYAAMTDFLAKTIPNRVSLLAIAFFVVAAPGIGMPLADIGWSIAGALVIFGLGLLPYSFGMMGAGDVKFATVAVLWLGWGQLMPFLLLFSVYGGVFTLLILYFSNHIRASPRLQIGFFADIDDHLPVPYGIALTVAALQLYPTSLIARLAI